MKIELIEREGLLAVVWQGYPVGTRLEKARKELHGTRLLQKKVW